jgi:hypothetical protein
MMSALTNGGQPAPRKRGRPSGLPKTGGRKAGTPNKLSRRDLLARIVALEKAVADLARKG